MSWDEAAKLAPIFTASIALFAVVVAVISIITQKAVARKRAAIEPNGERTYDKLLQVNARWTGRPRLWQRWRY